MNIFRVTFEGHVFKKDGTFAYSVERVLNVVAASIDILDIQHAVERALQYDFGSFYMHSVEPLSPKIAKFHYEAQPYDVADLVDVTWHPYGDNEAFKSVNSRGCNGYIIGTVVKGSTTSRLFHATSTKQWPTNVEKQLHYIPIDQVRFDAEGNATYISATCG